MKTAALALLLVTACDPTWNARYGWEESGESIPPDTQAIYAAAHALAPCAIEPWGGWVDWRSQPFDCAGVQASGCFIGSLDLSAHLIITNWPLDRPIEGPLAHELGHYVHARCSGDYSEAAASDFALKVRAYISGL